MKNKKGFEFSFGWIFAIIVGAVVIFLAIYAATNLIKQERKVSDTEAGKELGIILNPLETSFEEGKISLISLPEETRIFNGCKSTGNFEVQRTFGVQEISIASKSGLGEAWQEPGIPSSFYNKYIFSPGVVEEKEIIVFSKPFSMPYEIANIIILIPNNEKYCFVNPPSYIKDEFENDFKPENINITDEIRKCERESKKICFTSTGCDIDVNLETDSVRKKGQNRVYYEEDSRNENALIYGAIFSDSGIYECQIKRLMLRASQLAGLYRAKSESLTPKGCSSNLESDLDFYANMTKALNSSLDLRKIKLFANELEDRNNLLTCKLF